MVKIRRSGRQGDQPTPQADRAAKLQRAGQLLMEAYAAQDRSQPEEALPLAERAVELYAELAPRSVEMARALTGSAEPTRPTVRSSLLSAITKRHWTSCGRLVSLQAW